MQHAHVLLMLVKTSCARNAVKAAADESTAIPQEGAAAAARSGSLPATSALPTAAGSASMQASPVPPPAVFLSLPALHETAPAPPQLLPVDQAATAMAEAAARFPTYKGTDKAAYLCIPGRLIAMWAASSSMSPFQTEQAKDTFLNSFDTDAEGAHQCLGSGHRKQRDVYCRACYSVFHTVLSFRTWYAARWNLAKKAMDIADGVGEENRAQEVRATAGVSGSDASQLAAEPTTAPSLPGATPKAAAGPPRPSRQSATRRSLRMVVQAVRFLVRINITLAWRKIIKEADGELANVLMTLHSRRAAICAGAAASAGGASQPAGMEGCDVLRSTFFRAAHALQAAQKAFFFLPGIIAPDKFQRLTQQWEAKEAKRCRALAEANKERTFREASYSTDDETKRPMLRHRKPKQDTPGGLVFLPDRVRPTEEERERSASTQWECLGCMLKLSRSHYRHGAKASRCQWRDEDGRKRPSERRCSSAWRRESSSGNARQERKRSRPPPRSPRRSPRRGSADLRLKARSQIAAAPWRRRRSSSPPQRSAAAERPREDEHGDPPSARRRRPPRGIGAEERRTAARRSARPHLQQEGKASPCTDKEGDRRGRNHCTRRSRSR